MASAQQYAEPGAIETVDIGVKTAQAQSGLHWLASVVKLAVELRKRPWENNRPFLYS
jgi:hypothetical protein